MPDKKLTDLEIVKALEWHLNNENNCAECPLVVIKNSTTYCVDVLLQNALDLINRLKEKNSNLTSDLTSLQNDLISAKAEIERLTVLADLGNVRANDYRAMRDKCKTAKAEAYKEFAERLKDKYKPYVILGSGVAEIEINNLLKELVGDDI